MSAGPRPSRIALIGFMGSGKTTVGRELARALGWDFVDLDALIEERAGRRITEIFTAEGEAAFRAREAACLSELGGRERIVVAAGGGTPVAEANRGFFSGAATFHLAVSLGGAMTRTGGDASRPLIARGPAALQDLYTSRLPLYRSLGKEVRTEGRAPAEVAGEIIRILGLTTPDRGPG